MRAVPDEEIVLRVSQDNDFGEGRASVAEQSAEEQEHETTARQRDRLSSETDTAQMISIRLDHLKGSVALSATTTCFGYAFMAALFALMPWTWLYGQTAAPFDVSMIYWTAVILLGLLTMLVVQAVQFARKPPKEPFEHELNVSPHAAFELCLQNIPDGLIVRIDEAAGEIDFTVSSTHKISFRINGADEPSKSSISIKHSCEIRYRTFFWTAEAQSLMKALTIAQCVSLTTLLKRIDDAACQSHGITYGAPVHAPVLVNCTPKRPRWMPSPVVGCALLFLLYWTCTTLATFDQMIYCLSKHSPKEALTLCNLRLNVAPSADAWQSRGRVYLRLGDANAAAADFRKSNDSKGLLSAALIMQDRLDDASAVFAETKQKAIRDSLTPKLLKNKLAWCAANESWIDSLRGNYDAAIKEANRALLLSPKYAFAYSARGYARHRMGDNEGAVVDYSTSFAIQKNCVALQLRSKAEQDLGRIEQAAEDRANAHATGFRRTDLAIPASYDDFGDPTNSPRVQ